MNLPIAIADPNADLEAWIKNCSREMLERMYFFMFIQASEAMEKLAAANKQLENERGLPDKNREGIYGIRVVDAVKHAEFVCTQEYLQHLIDHSVSNLSDELFDVLKELSK